MSRTLDHLRAMALKAVPELEAADLQLLRHLPGWPRLEADAYALSSLSHPGVRQELEERGLWRGAWPSVIVFQDDDPPHSILAHELAHLVPAVEPRPDYEPITRHPGFAEYHARRTTSIEPPTLPWADDHGDAFIRRAVHCAVRLVAAGATIFAHALVIAGETYGLSPGLKYIEALDSEPQRLAGLSFAELELIEAPLAFSQLFESDVEAWHQRNPSA